MDMTAISFAHKVRLIGYLLCKCHFCTQSRFNIKFIGLCPKRWLNAQFIYGLYHHANIMTEDFTEQFVDNPRIGFIADMFTE